MDFSLFTRLKGRKSRFNRKYNGKKNEMEINFEVTDSKKRTIDTNSFTSLLWKTRKIP